MRLLLLGGLSLAACGYRFDRDFGQARIGEARALPRVAVIPFDNRTYRRGLEMELTRLVHDELRARSPRASVRPEEADWLLRGTVTRADERIYSEDRDDEVRESSFLIEVSVVLEERASEKTVRTYSFVEREPFSARAGRTATLSQAREQALRDLAEKIVYWLEDRGSQGNS